MTRALQQQKHHRHPKRPKLPAGETGTPTKRIVHTAVYKQNVNQYNEALKQYIDQLLSDQATELIKITNFVDAIVINLQTSAQLAKRRTTIPLIYHHSVSTFPQYLS